MASTLSSLEHSRADEAAPALPKTNDRLGYALGAWLILDRNRFALENARWHRTKMPDSADPKVRRLSAFGFALLGVVIGGTGLYVIALIAKATP